jgi:hypothetical protein
MDDERIIGEIEQQQEMIEAPDSRVPGASDLAAENRRHEKNQAHSACVRLWQR